jgi:CBS domain-containing protein
MPRRDNPRMPRKESVVRVKELMSQPVYTCHIDQSVQAAAQAMWEHDCGIVPVVDNESRLVGVITDRDICMAALFRNQPLSDIQISSVMASEVSTCRPEDPLIDAEHLMSQRQVHRLPVVNERGAPTGVLSLSDVARRVRRSNGSKNGALDLAETIAAISEPHHGATAN